MPDTAAVIETDIPARLDRLPWTRFHTLVVVALGITWILDGLEVTLAGSIAGALQESPVLHFEAAWPPSGSGRSLVWASWGCAGCCPRARAGWSCTPAPGRQRQWSNKSSAALRMPPGRHCRRRQADEFGSPRARTPRWRGWCW